MQGIQVPVGLMIKVGGYQLQRLYCAETVTMNFNPTTMARKYSLAVILTLSMVTSYSQLKKGKQLVDFSFGPSFPVGAYAGTDLPSNSSGFATTGQFVKISYANLQGKQIGISAAIHAQRNPINTASIEESFSKVKIAQGPYFFSAPNQPPAQGPYAVYPDWRSEKSSWLFASLLVGGFGEFRRGQTGKAAFTTRMLVGVVYAASPRLSGTSTTDTASAMIEQSRGSAFGLAYSLAGGIRVYVARKVYLLTGLEYFGSSKLVFKDIKSKVGARKDLPGLPVQIQQAFTTKDVKQRIASVNLNLGIGMRW
jgi:hypothetical protein